MNFTQQKGKTLKKLLSKWIAVLAIVGSQNVWAIPITDTVIVGAQEWAQVNLFTNVSWDAIDAQCPSGVCSPTSTLNGYSLDTWKWASIDQIQTLFSAFTGQVTTAPGNYAEDDSTWAPAFLRVFDSTRTDFPGPSVNGWSSTDIDSEGYVSLVGDSLTPIVPDMTATNITRAKDVMRPTVGGWFVRDTSQVPAPATLALFGLGLGSIWISRRKRVAKV